MPFSFSAVCDLLQTLELDHKRKQQRKERGSPVIVNNWFDRHQETINGCNVDRVALLSTLLPERRTDRVYNIQRKKLERIVIKALFIGITRRETLRRWETDHRAGVDLAECVEHILTETPNGVEQDLTVEEIDDTLHQLAAGVAFSSPAVRASRGRSTADTLTPFGGHPLDGILRRLSPRDAKWFCRLVLKNFLPVIVPESLVYRRCDPLLPSFLKVRDDFAVAIALLDNSQKSLSRANVLDVIKPQMGVKVGRQSWQKARSIKHCLQMGSGSMSCEKKMDGEYCQIHIDLSKGYDSIQIFSKSGKDSTRDREKVHGAIRSSLALGSTSCKFKKSCIVEGELVVWSDRDKKVLGFEKIRKHVSRSGRFVGTDWDSQAYSWERLMIVYFDVLLIDDESLLNTQHSERRRRLSGLIHCQEGVAALVESQTIDFSLPRADEELRDAFAACIQNREEGLVLKPDEPYFSFESARRNYASCCIKLKKGYIKNMGDVGDFAVVGARYDATAAKVLGNPKVKYTHFYLGCMTNKEAATRYDAKPKFIVVNEVELNAEMAEQFRRSVWTGSPDKTDKLELHLPPGIMKGRKMVAVFSEPAVFDVTCFSFHKESNTRFWGLRFPYVTKIHHDRSWRDCLSFDELQELAEADRKCPVQEESLQLAKWIEALENAEPNSRRAVGNGSQSTHETDSICNTQSVDGDLQLPSAGPKVLACTRAGAVSLTTPPTFSAIEPPLQSPSERAIPRKRQRKASQTSPRRSRQRLEMVDLTSSPETSQQSQQEARPPLEDITSAPSSQGNIPPPIAAARLFRAETVPLSFPSPSKATSSNATAAATCRIAGSSCAVANYFVLLAPCVANVPWLTEDLLPAHGAAGVFTDIASWRTSAALQTNARRVILVESRRNEATQAFLDKLQAQLQDEPSKVAIAYDWRLLEAVTDEEKKLQKKDAGYEYSQRKRKGAMARELWMKYYVGMC